MKVGIIGGTGLYGWGDSEELIINTPYGNISVFHSAYANSDLFFLPRHGKDHKIPPHNVNYRGIISALDSCGIAYLLSLCTVGSMKENITPGSFVNPCDFIDFTRRKTTFFDTRVVHVDMSVPFCPLLQKTIQDVLEKSGETFHSGIYIATEGPRLETPSEIAMFSRFGDIVGMTLVPEAILAREKGLCYASLCLVSSMCAGLQASLPVHEIVNLSDTKKDTIHDMIFSIFDSLPETKTCLCSSIVQDGSL